MPKRLSKKRLSVLYPISEEAVNSVHFLRVKTLWALPGCVMRWWGDQIRSRQDQFPLDALRAAVNNLRQKG